MDAWVKYLEDTWGLNSNFAKNIALFILWANYYGLQPRIQSGYRDPDHQRQLRARWDAGDRAGLRAPPAIDSLHTRKAWGHPDAKAIDIASNDESIAARLARALGIGAGLYFKKPDPGHYYELLA